MRNKNIKNLISYLLSLKSSSGFTIIELLVVITIFIAVGTVVSAILVSSLRGSNKTKAFNNLESNGNYVVAQVSKMVRFARKFDGISTDGVTFTSNCALPTPGAGTPTPTAPVYKAIKITSYDGGQTQLSCDTTTIASYSATCPANSNCSSLLDTSTVSLSSCVFTCVQSSPSDFPTIGIKFTLTQFQPTGTSFFLPENTASADFQTAVSPRNLNR